MTEPEFFLAGANFIHLLRGAAGGGEPATPTSRGSGQVAAPAPMTGRPSPSSWTSSTPPSIAGSCSSASAPQASGRLGWAGHLAAAGGRMGVAARGGGWPAAASAWRRRPGALDGDWGIAVRMLDADCGQGERRAALDWEIGEPNWALTGLIKLTKQRPSVLAAQQESSSSYRCLVRRLIAMA